MCGMLSSSAASSSGNGLKLDGTRNPVAGGLFLSRWRGIWIIFAILEHLTEASLDTERLTGRQEMFDTVHSVLT